MADLIDRDAVLAEIGEFQMRFNETGDSHERVAYASAEHCKLVIKAAPAVNCWIPCSERMPEDGQKCIVCMADKSIRLAVWRGDYDEWGVWQISKKLYRTRTVPAWMPLPDAYEPPEEGDNDA